MVNTDDTVSNVRPVVPETNYHLNHRDEFAAVQDKQIECILIDMLIRLTKVVFTFVISFSCE